MVVLTGVLGFDIAKMSVEPMVCKSVVRPR
jgi:hypothetical protein